MISINCSSFTGPPYIGSVGARGVVAPSWPLAKLSRISYCTQVQYTQYKITPKASGIIMHSSTLTCPPQENTASYTGLIMIYKVMCGSHGFSSDVCMRNFVRGDLFHYFLVICHSYHFTFLMFLNFYIYIMIYSATEVVNRIFVSNIFTTFGMLKQYVLVSLSLSRSIRIGWPLKSENLQFPLGS